tara:strand:+ start:2461 stop:3387 length:927 start_codon:yes stop_codon:yes gene_type:complete
MKLKKPKFWDIKKPNLIAYLLLPISLIIQLFVIVKKFNSKKKYKIKCVCIGNIYIGGTGKTSLSIELNEILKKRKFKSCFIKKFYKDQLDEQTLLKNKGKLFLSRKRSLAAAKAEKENYEIAIFDDGLQDNNIEYSSKIVCFNSINWIGNGLTIPAGPLRESIQNLKNYDHVFINGVSRNLDFIKNQILEINPKISINIGEYIITNLNEFDKRDKFFAFSGIGNHQTFISTAEQNGLQVKYDLEYPDHYQYKKKDIEKIYKISSELNCKIITTEKDYLRLKNFNLENIKFIKSKLKILNEDKLIQSII